MSLGSLVRGALRQLPLSPENRHHGLQLAAAVIIAYLASMTVGLPERFWAVMSVLIVMRPNAGATLDAGWDRVCGTMAGALCGLLGVYLQQLGANPLVTTLAIVAALAFASAATPALRSAAVAALIILGAGQLAGHSASQAGLLRVVQIGIGVAVAMAVALASSRHHAAARLHAGSASLLRRAADQLRQASVRAKATESEAEAASAAARNALGRLALVAGSADRESRLFRRAAPEVDSRHHRRIAGLTGRILQDIALLTRVLHTMSQHDECLRREVVQAASAALASAADAVAHGSQLESDSLRRFAEGRIWNVANAAASRESAVLLAAPIRLLLEDLQQLCRRARSRIEISFDNYQL